MKISCLKVGGRTIKTVVAVFLCLLTGIIRKSDTAFYAAIAAVLCVQRTSKDSFREAFNREVATVIVEYGECSFCCSRGMSGASHMAYVPQFDTMHPSITLGANFNGRIFTNSFLK
jgi:hypothetical protein